MNYKNLEECISDRLLDLSIKTGVSYNVLNYNWKHQQQVIKCLFPQHYAYESRVMVKAYHNIKHNYEMYKKNDKYE